MKFDIDLGGNLMGAGDQNGNVNTFSLGAEPTDEVGAEVAPLDGTAPTLKYHAHDDTVGSVAFHPLNPLLLSVSGSRHFDETESDGEECSDSSVRGESMSRDDAQVFIQRHRHQPQPYFRDNSFSLWHFVA